MRYKKQRRAERRKEASKALINKGPIGENKKKAEDMSSTDEGTRYEYIQLGEAGLVMLTP